MQRLFLNEIIMKYKVPQPSRERHLRVIYLIGRQGCLYHRNMY
jgi:hypothetical protein